MTAAVAPVGIWLGASYVLGRDVPASEPYPHICHIEWFSTSTSKRVKLRRLDCAACVAQFQRQTEPTGELPAVDADVLAAEARRLGEHDTD